MRVCSWVSPKFGCEATKAGALWTTSPTVQTGPYQHDSQRGIPRSEEMQLGFEMGCQMASVLCVARRPCGLAGSRQGGTGNEKFVMLPLTAGRFPKALEAVARSNRPNWDSYLIQFGGLWNWELEKSTLDAVGAGVGLYEGDCYKQKFYLKII